jgi:hypothetical protein
MMSVVVLMGISSLYVNVITSLLMIQRVLSRVCRKTNNYFVALLCARMSSFLLQKLESIHPARKSPPYMECFWGKKPINSDLPLTESLNAICNLTYRENITKATVQEVLFLMIYLQSIPQYRSHLSSAFIY